MTDQDSQPVPPTELRRSDRLIRLAIFISGFLLMTGLGSGIVVSELEEDDEFCASCHVVPERTYYNRAQLAIAGEEPILDLSSAHYLADPSDLPHDGEFRCIDCHRGNEGLTHRLTAIALGTRDSLIYIAGNPDPTIEKTEIEVPVLLTESCLKCHSQEMLVVGFGNHFHNRLPLARKIWEDGGQLTTPIDRDPALFERDLDEGLDTIEVNLLCVDCHLTHINTPGAELQGFIDLESVVFPACEECHAEALGSPLGLSAPNN